MNKSRQFLPRLQLILVLSVFILTLSLAITYKDQLQDAVVIPLLYLLWVGDLVFKSFDQQCIWLLSLFIALVISLSFARREKNLVENPPTVQERHSLVAGRTHFWRTQVRLSASKVYARGYRRSELRRLVTKALSYHENCDEEQIKAQIRSGQLVVPSEVRSILGVDDHQDEPNPSLSFIENIRQRFAWLIERFAEPRFIPDPRIEKIVEYLESIMEVDNDTGNR